MKAINTLAVTGELHRESPKRIKRPTFPLQINRLHRCYQLRYPPL